MPGKKLPSRTRGTRNSSVPTRVSQFRSRYPLRSPCRSGLRWYRSAPRCWATSSSISAWVMTRTPSRSVSKSGSASALRRSSASAMLRLSAIVWFSFSGCFNSPDENHRWPFRSRAAAKPHTSVDSTWRWKSRSRGGRPHLSPEVQELIATMSRENRLWGTERIRGELLKLGIVVSNRSIRRYRWRGPRRPSSQTWRTFLANHAHHLWAADLFTVPTLTFKTLYVLEFIAHARRELVHVNVTDNPTAAWVWRQLIEATPWGNQPRHLLHDHDGVYGRDFDRHVQRIGIDGIATPSHAPKPKTVAERVIGTLRRECPDHL